MNATKATPSGLSEAKKAIREALDSAVDAGMTFADLRTLGANIPAGILDTHRVILAVVDDVLRDSNGDLTVFLSAMPRLEYVNVTVGVS